MPVFSLMGLTEEPVVLDGFGPVPPSMARDLVAHGADSFHRVLIDPRVIAEVDRKKPIGVSRNGWVNLLLQKAIASEPEPLARD